MTKENNEATDRSAHEELRNESELEVAGEVIAALHHPPQGFDDRHDPSMREFQLPPEQRKQPTAPPPETLRAMRLRTDAPEETAIRIAGKVTGSAGVVEPLLETAKTAEASADPEVAAAASLEPKLRLRVQALVCRNSDGRMSNGHPGQSRAELETAISHAITLTNTIMASANVELVFYPSADLEIRYDTYLNQDFVLYETPELKKLKQTPPISRDEANAITTNYHRNSVAKTYPGKLVLLFAEGTTLSGTRDHFGQAGDKPLAADFDGDGRADVAVWRPADGTWHVLASRHGGYRSVQWGQQGDVPVPADYGGDLRDDMAVWRPSNGTWYILDSSTGKSSTVQWGQQGDIPVPANYDDHHRASVAVWRPSDGMWHIKDVATGKTRSVLWGQQGDIPVPADYDGDGKADIAVWRPSNGTWYIIDSSTGKTRTVQWGQKGDVPVPAHYERSSRANAAVWRPSDGKWYLLKANGTWEAHQWGQAGDIPVPGGSAPAVGADPTVWRPSNGQWYVFERATGNYRHDDWQAVSPSGGGFSWSDLEFVKLGGWVNPDPNDYGQATFIAHEVGHNLHLWHTMTEARDYSVSDEEAAGKTDAQLKDFIVSEILRELNEEKAKGTATNLLAQNLMDPDRGSGVTDTSPDPGPHLIHYLNRAAHGSNSGACGPIGSHAFKISTGESVTIAPDRSLVMSYFKGCPGFVNRFSLGQSQRMRGALTDGNRRHLVKVQLGETSFPGEVVAGMWDPNPKGQFYTWNNTYEQFRANYDTQKAQGMRLYSQQAYTKDGVTKYDGIWNPGDYQQDVIWGWEVGHFATRHTTNVANGWYLHHLESYLLPDGQVRVNAIWNKAWANVNTTWVQGWAEVDLIPKLTQMNNSGWRVRHLNAWNLPNNGPVRYDVVWEAVTWREDVVRLNMTGAQVVSEYGYQWNRGYKFRVLDTFRVGGEQRYAGVWNPNTNGQLVLWGHTREQIRETYDEMWNQGWKLGSMAMVKF